MTNLVARDATARLRLIPPGKKKKKLPWFGVAKTCPDIGYPVLWEEMTEAERDKLYEVYLEEGLGALRDAVEFLNMNVWPHRNIRRNTSSIERGRNLLEGR